MQPHSPKQAEPMVAAQQPSDLLLSPDIKKLLKDTARANWISMGIPVTLAILAFVTAAFEPYLFVLFIMLAIMSFVLVAYRINKYQGKFILAYRQKVVNTVLQNISGNITYEPESYISAKVFLSSGLLDRLPNIYEASNYVLTKYPDCDLEYSYVYAVKQVGGNSSENGSSTSIMMHDGWVLLFSLPFYFSHGTIVHQDLSKESIFGDVNEGPDHIFKKYDRIAVPDGEFEKEFQVYGTDPKTTLELLDADLRSFLVDARKKFRTKIQCSFMGNYMFVTIHTGKNSFKPRFVLSGKSGLLRQTIQEAQWLYIMQEYFYREVKRLVEKYK